MFWLVGWFYLKGGWLVGLDGGGIGEELGWEFWVILGSFGDFSWFFVCSFVIFLPMGKIFSAYLSCEKESMHWWETRGLKQL